MEGRDALTPESPATPAYKLRGFHCSACDSSGIEGAIVQELCMERRLVRRSISLLGDRVAPQFKKGVSTFVVVAYRLALPLRHSGCSGASSILKRWNGGERQTPH